MFRIFCSNTTTFTRTTENTLHNPELNDERFVVFAPIIEEALNTHGSLSFSVSPIHALYESLVPRSTYIMAECDVNGGQPWFGRIISTELGIDNTINVYCEGELACLADVTYPPFGFTGSPDQLLRNLVDYYNSQTPDGYKFYVGNVSVIDSNNTIVRSNSESENIWMTINNRLFGSSLGGFILPRYDSLSQTHFIDYLRLDSSDPFARYANQSVEYAKNILRIEKTVDASGVVTMVDAYGAEYDQDSQEYEGAPPANGFWNGNRVRVGSANSGENIIANAAGIMRFGRIVGAQTWDDITDPQNLLARATEWLEKHATADTRISVEAIDMSLIDPDVEQIRVGDTVRVRSTHHSVDDSLICVSKTTNFEDISKSTLTLGTAEQTLTGLVGGD